MRGEILGLPQGSGLDPRGSSLDEHERIVAAIETRDEDKARQAMREHLTRSLETVRSAQF